MANVKFDRRAIGDLMRYNPGVKSALMSAAKQIEVAAKASASAAEATTSQGEGYASAGFSTRWEQRSRRPRVVVTSNAPGEIAMAVHFASQRAKGVAHLTAASKTRS